MTVGMPSANNVPRSLMRYAPPVSLEPRPDDFDLLAGFRLIRRRIVMIVLLAVLLTAAAIPLILGMKPLYRAESRLMIHPPLAAGLARDDPGGGDTLDLGSEIERLRSRNISERVIRELKLDERKEFNPALRGTSFIGRLRKMLGGLVAKPASPPAGEDGMERVIQEYYRALSVGRDGATSVIRIGFESGDPELAAAVPNRLISIYLEERQNSLRRRLGSALAWIDQRVEEQRSRVSAAREATERYAKATGVASEGPDEQARAVMELSARQARILQNRAQVNATISALQAAGDRPEALADLVVPDSIGTLERNLRRQQRDLDRLLKTYGDNAEEVVAERARIVKTQSDLEVERERYVQSQRAMRAALDLQEAAVRADLMAARRKLSGDALAQAELTRQQHVVDREQGALDKLEEQRRTLAAAAALPGAEAEILSPAAVPLLPQGHGRMFYLIVAMLASVCIAATAAFIREMMDRSVRSYDQLEAIPGIIPAGLVPLLSRAQGRSLPVFFGHSQAGVFGEAVRSAVIALKQSNGGRFPASVVVTSAQSGEGKSLLARSLAIELAATGQRVLLIDGDLRHGNIGSLFEPGLSLGLNDFLVGQAALADIVRHHSRTGVDFIPRGNPCLDRRPNLASIAAVLEFARVNGQVAIFDSAPILASTDTVQLATLTERTMLVAHWGEVSRQAIEYALRRVKSLSRSDVIVIINRVNSRIHSMYGFKDSETISKKLMEYQKRDYG